MKSAAPLTEPRRPYRQTARNTPARLFLEKLSGGAAPTSGGTVSIALSGVPIG